MPEDFEKNKDSRFPRISFEAGLIVFIALGLSIFGLIVQTSAGQYHHPSDSLYTFKRQAIFFVPALLCGVIAARLNLERFRRHAWWILGIAMVVLFSIYVPGFGKVVNGSRRWVDFAFFRLQVSDPAKIALVFVLAHYLAGAQRHFLPVKFKRFERRGYFYVPTPEARTDFLYGFLIPSGIIGLICAGVAVEPDLGTTVLCAAVGFTMLFLAGGRFCYFVCSFVAGIAAVSVSIPAILVSMKWFPVVEKKFQVFCDNRWKRFLSFWYTEELKADDSYQLWNALTGIASGEFFGKGLGEGMIYRGFLPEAHTDCVFAVIGEEFGFCGTVLIPAVFLALFGLVVSQLRKITDVFYFNICLGSGLFILLQAVVNMFVNLGLLPTKGMSLPFISYGGSNLVVMFIFIGLIWNAIHRWRVSAFPKISEF